MADTHSLSHSSERYGMCGERVLETCVCVCMCVCVCVVHPGRAAVSMEEEEYGCARGQQYPDCIYFNVIAITWGGLRRCDDDDGGGAATQRCGRH